MYMLLQNDWKNIDGIFVEKEYFLAKKKFNIDLKHTELISWLAKCSGIYDS